jgi:hypothetical protein
MVTYAGRDNQEKPWIPVNLIDSQSIVKITIVAITSQSAFFPSIVQQQY